MSSVRPNFNGKRLLDYESSENENEDISPIKKVRRCQRETNIKQSLTSHCRTLWQWLSELPLKDYVVETLKKTTLMHCEPPDVIVLDDDEEEDDVIPIEDEEEDSEISVINVGKKCSSLHTEYSCKSCKYESPKSFLDAISEKTLYSLPVRNKPRLTLTDIREREDLHKGSKSISTSTPLYHDPETAYNGFEPPCRKSVNDFDINKWGVKNGHDDELLDDTPLRTGKHFSPITNPGIDVEILLDDKNDVSAGEDSDELEIISEVSPVKHKAGPLSKKLAPVKYSLTAKGRGTSFKDTSKMNGSTLEKKMEKSHSSSNLFTAHEVVRLQEMEQYKLLLDRMASGSLYHPIVSKSGSRCAEVQVDLTGDDEDPVVGCHFKREIFKQPVTEFLEKYYKPCQLVSPTKLGTSVLIGADRLYEDVAAVETKLPEYKPRNRSMPDFFSPSWIENLKISINQETKLRLEIVTEQEQKIERYRKRRDAKIAEDNRRRDEFALKANTKAENEFPALTPEMEHIIDLALDPSASNPCLVKLDNHVLSSADMSTLHGLNWLNDQVINFYMALIVERGKLDNYPSVYAYNSFFYTSLRSRGEQQVTRWTKKVDIFAHDILFIPLHLGMHWALAVIDNRLKKIRYYDSLLCEEDKCVVSFQNYLVAEMKDKKKMVMDPNTYTMEMVKNIPRQMNGSDCGMFTLKYAEYVAREVEITFTQENMPYFRRRMVYELLTKQLM